MFRQVWGKLHKALKVYTGYCPGGNQCVSSTNTIWFCQRMLSAPAGIWLKWVPLDMWWTLFTPLASSSAILEFSLLCNFLDLKFFFYYQQYFIASPFFYLTYLWANCRLFFINLVLWNSHSGSAHQPPSGQHPLLALALACFTQPRAHSVPTQDHIPILWALHVPLLSPKLYALRRWVLPPSLAQKSLCSLLPV